KALKSNPEILQTLRVLLEYIDAALNGKRYQQMSVNILGTDAESIAYKVAAHPATRGLQGPTIAPIYSASGHAAHHGDAQWYTVTIIVQSKDVLHAVEYLRSIGASQMSTVPLRYAFLENAPTFTRLVKQLE